jgi:hypothetical protein
MMGRVDSRGSWPRLAWHKNKTPIFKIIRDKWAVGMAQAIEHLPTKVEAQSSQPQYHQK